MSESKDATGAKILVLYYSTWGHIAALAEAVAKGARATGATVDIKLIPETLPKEVLEKMHAAPQKDYPVAHPDDLAKYDAILFGIPTRYGGAAAQVKAFLDATGGLWKTGALVGKIASVFFSTGSQNGGQETTALTFFTNLVHHGMIIVPIGYSNPALFDMSAPHGGSPYGAGTLAGDGSRAVSEAELGVGEHQGKHVAAIANKLKKGSQ